MRRILVKEGSLLSFFDCRDADNNLEPVGGNKEKDKYSNKQFYHERKGGKQGQHLQPLQQ